MNLADITVVVGVDAVTIQQLEVSLPTWRKNRPELWQCPWIVFADRDSPSLFTGDAWCKIIDVPTIPQTQLVCWPPVGAKVQYETQRAKMVTGHVFIPAMYAKTPWSLKIDTDALALDSRPWLQGEWFEPDLQGRFNAIVASPWSYAKPKGGGGTVEDWARKLEAWGDEVYPGSPRLGLAERIVGNKIIYPRIASWLSVYHVPWLRQLAEACKSCGEYRLPVPSQDTVAHYYAARRGDRIHRTNMKRFGWTNVSHLDDLRAKAAEIMGATTRNALI